MSAKMICDNPQNRKGLDSNYFFHSRSIVGGDYSSITSQQSSTASNSHYHNRQMHDAEFMSPSSSKIRGPNEHFQQHGGPLISSSPGDIRHPHQPDFGIGGTSNDAGSLIFLLPSYLMILRL